MPVWQTAIYMLVLGFGLGMTMQVLVLAAQNAVPYEQLGVATSGSTLFRQVGGSIGVSIFGAIFANRLATNLADALPPGVQPPRAASPSSSSSCRPRCTRPTSARSPTSLQPVFAAAAGVSLFAFLLTLAAARGAAAQERRGRGRRRELRDAARGRIAARAGADRDDARAAREPLARLRPARRASRTSTSTPAELWLLARLGEGADVDLERRAARGGTRLAPRPRPRRERTASPARASSSTRTSLEARREGLVELLEGWAPEEHDEVLAMLDRSRTRARRRDPRAGSSRSCVAISGRGAE